MGLKELDLLKTTLLKIDDVDNEVKQLRDESKVLRKEIKNNESTITKRELEISNLEQQIPTLENKIANIEEGGYPSSSEEQSKINKLTKRLTIIVDEEDELTTSWKKSLNEYSTTGDILPFFVLIIGIPIFSFLSAVFGLVLFGFHPVFACCGIWFVLLAGFFGIEEVLVYRRRVRSQLKLKQEHGQLANHYPGTMVGIQYTTEEMVKSCRIMADSKKNTYEFNEADIMVENDDIMATPQINRRKLKKKFNNHYQLYPPALFKTNVRKKKLNEKISTLKTQINKIDDKVRNHKYTLKTSKSEIIIKKQSITKKHTFDEKKATM